ncbi:MAG: hypothetical protein GXP23_08620 [Gammaproteobacteria bacterium]|nr:hypothetical protein [Gammaproteobacteria bacterium]
MSNKIGITTPLLSVLALLLVLTVPTSVLAAPAPSPVPTASAQEETSATPPQADVEEDSEIRKVVWHADFADPRRFSAMLTSVNNMVNTFQEALVDYDVRIVFVSYGIRFLTNDKLAGTPFEEDAELARHRPELIDRLKSLQDIQEVKLELCEITRVAVGLPKEKLIEGVISVPSGVVRIAELQQQQGFAYLKVE